MTLGRLLRLCALATLLGACSVAPPSPVRSFEVLTPRPFGYLLGDEIEQRIHAEVRRGFDLRRNSLPAAGTLNRGLDVKQVRVAVAESGSTVSYDLTLRYQIFYAPLEVKMLVLPGFKLVFGAAGKAVEQAVPDWHFTVSPLRELALRKEGEREYLRPDAMPPFIADELLWLRCYAALLAAAAAALGLAYRYGYLPGMQRRSIFKRASRQLAQLPQHDTDMALAILHGAFNELYRRPLFGHRLAEFYRLNPEYAAAREQLRWFFGCSNRYFFGSEQLPADAMPALKELCRLCREIERGSR